jgi:CubicO group peptidase (beta-lactamase class C family)
MRRVLTGFVERKEVPGVVTLVSRRGETHVGTLGTMAYGSPELMRRDTIFRVASMTKPVAAVAAMILVEECRLRLDDPVDPFLPELADRRVLARIDGPVTETVPAHRAITLRDLLTLRMGFGYLFDPAAQAYPIQDAIREQGIRRGPPKPQDEPEPDEWIRRVGQLPLMYHPGERWMYDLGLDVLGVLIARAARQPLDVFMRERIFDPLGMKDTGFYVPEEKIGRLATSYMPNFETGEPVLYDEPINGHWSQPPAFPSAAGGLVSTVDDFLAFGQMMLNKGKLRSERILSRPSVELMTTDQVTPEQKAGMELILGDRLGWGFGMAVVARRDEVAAVPGRFGWSGGLGTAWYSDPAEDLVGVLLTQQAWTSPEGPKIWHDFWTSAYAAIAD